MHQRLELRLKTKPENCAEYNVHLLSRVEAGISNYLNQTEKYSMGGSTEGPIYSTIDATNEDLHGFTYAQHTSTAPYASTSIMPFTNQTQAPAHSSEQQDGGHWIPQPGPSGAQYAQPDRCSGEELSAQYTHIIQLSNRASMQRWGLKAMRCLAPVSCPIASTHSRAISSTDQSLRLIPRSQLQPVSLQFMKMK